jgi:hypothetical protein
LAFCATENARDMVDAFALATMVEEGSGWKKSPRRNNTAVNK